MSVLTINDGNLVSISKYTCFCSYKFLKNLSFPFNITAKWLYVKVARQEVLTFYTKHQFLPATFH